MGQNHRPQVIVQVDGVEQDEPGHDHDLCRHHHGGQKQGEDHPFAAKANLREGIGRQGSDSQLNGCAHDGDKSGIEVSAEHADLGTCPHRGIVVPMPCLGQPMPIDRKYLGGALQRGGNHPDQRWHLLMLIRLH